MIPKPLYSQPLLANPLIRDAESERSPLIIPPSAGPTSNLELDEGGYIIVDGIERKVEDSKRQNNAPISVDTSERCLKGNQNII